MKKTLFLTAFLLCSVTATFATIITVRVSNYKFSPSTVNAKLGDSILFKWQNGIHTTTSLSVPTGAASWNKPMDSAHKKFGYILKKTGTYSYDCTIHSAVMKGTINVTAALSSGFSDFSVALSQDAKALLNWKVKSESDIAYYSVQRSTDGDNFKEIASIKPTGNSSNVQFHSYTDNTAENSSKYVYYQVQIVDKSGNKQLSGIKMFTQKLASSKLITSISPNPISTTGHLMVQFNADKQGKMLMQLYSESGRFIKQAEMTADKGVNNGHFHLGDIMPGTYYVTCTLGTIIEKHIIIVK